MSESLEAVIGLLLATYRDPLTYQERLKGPLPEPLQPVLRLAAGKAIPGLKSLCLQWQTHPKELRQAALFFIEQACLEGEKDPYRLLGLHPGAEPHEIQAHYHLLMLLFHPDRMEAARNWKDAYAARVNQAYHQLRSPVRRRAYAHELAVKPPEKKQPPVSYPYRHPREKKEVLAYLVQRFPWVMRYLPQLLLGVGITVTLALVINLYLVWTLEETVKMASPEGGKAPSEASPPKTIPKPESLSPERVVKPGIAAEIDPPSQSIARAAVSGSEESRKKEAASSLETALLPPHPESLPSLEGSTPTLPPKSLPTSKLAAQPPPAAKNPVPQAEVPRTPQGAKVAGGETVSSPPVKEKEGIGAKERQEAGAATPQAVTDSASPSSLERAAVQRLLRRLVNTYQQGDLESFITLFSPDANTNDYAGKSAIREDYAQFFTSTQERQLQLREMQWQINGHTAQGKGRYIARVRNAQGIFVSRGQIRVQVQQREGANLITGLFNTIESSHDVSATN